jgi:hypothetical protein
MHVRERVANGEDQREAPVYQCGARRTTPRWSGRLRPPSREADDAQAIGRGVDGDDVRCGREGVVRAEREQAAAVAQGHIVADDDH